MEETRLRNLKLRSLGVQAPVDGAKAPQVVSEVLTLTEALKRFPGLYPEVIYAWARDGELHPIRPKGRTLYPEWELRRLVERFDTGGNQQWLPLAA